MSNPGVDGIRGYWKLNEETGVRNDEGFQNLDLVDNNTVGYDSGHQIFTGNSADFIAGNSESLSNADAFNYLRPGNNYFAAGLWIKPHVVGTFSTLLAKWDDPSNKEYAIQLDGGNKVRFVVNDGSSNYIVTASTFGNLSNNVWYFVTAYFDPDTNVIGIGVNDVWNTVAGPTAGIDLTAADFYLGTTADLTNYYDGLMDEVFVYIINSPPYITTANWTWLYNYGHGRRWEDIDEEPSPTVTVETGSVIPLIHVFDRDLEEIGIIEDYYSLNWAERYNSVGDFELELPIEYATSPLLTFGNFLYIKTSDKLMIIEEKKPEIADDKASLVVNGRSAESIFDRRVLMTPLTFYGTAELLAYILVNDNIRDTGNSREIPIFDTADTAIWPPAMLSSAAAVSEQFVEETVYEIIELVCKLVDLGFKIIVKDLVSPDSELYFHIYEGVDRSTGQSDNDWVIFADVYDNILKSSFYSSELDNINVVLVVVDDLIYPETLVSGPGGPFSGLDLFEGYLDTTIDRDSDGDDIDDIDDWQYMNIIVDRGLEVIKQATPVGVFEGDFETRGMFTYGVDFFMGDIVQCVMHGEDVAARVIELVRSYGPDGEKVYLAFDFLV